MALYAKSNQVVKARKLEEDVLLPIAEGEMLCIAFAGDYLTWDDSKGFRGFIEGAEFEEKYMFVGGE
jgi:hypothetical protein